MGQKGKAQKYEKSKGSREGGREETIRKIW